MASEVETQDKPRVLVVDDEMPLVQALLRVLTRAGFEVTAVTDPVEGLQAALEPDVRCALFDINMPHLSGLELLRDVKKKRPELEVIMMTAFATIGSAVEAVKEGAFDYLTKPFDNVEEVVIKVRKAIERSSLVARNRQLEEMLSAKQSFEELVGGSRKMQALFKLIESVGPTNATVLIQGESGTGKELVARALHRRSERKTKPFLAVNCSALPETLLDSELFGHVKGAFTGAHAQKKGLFEAAHGGTLFLDEIGDISPATQVRLLRVLQEGEIKRVGSSDTIKVDVRVIAATHVNFDAARKAGKFREDLYYRLNVIGLKVPPLRDRPEDISILAHHFLERHAKRAKKEVSRISPETMESLVTNPWTGNVRELEHIIERAVVLSTGPELTLEQLPEEFVKKSGGGEFEPGSLAGLPYAQAKKLAMRAFDRRYLVNLMRRTRGNISSAARAAALDRSNFRRLLRQYEFMELADAAGEEAEVDGPAPSEEGAPAVQLKA